MEIKIIMGIIASLVVLFAYSSYIKDVFKGKVKPHVYSWLIWTLSAGVSSSLQIYGGAGSGAWPTIAVTILCFFIFLLSLKNGKKYITKLDTLILILTIFSLALWLLVDKPILSSILMSIVIIGGFIPTIRKIWFEPLSETLFLYIVNASRHILSIFALAQFNFLTLFYPIVYLIGCLCVIFIASYRRKR